MAEGDAAPVKSDKLPPQRFGQGYTLDCWYFAALSSEVRTGKLKRYELLGRLVRPMLAGLDLVAAQNSAYAERFTSLGASADRVHVTGSLKFDGAQTDRANPATMNLRELADFAASDIVFLAGSTQEPEEQLAIEAFKVLAQRYPHLRLVIVPRHPERFAEVGRTLSARSA